MSTIETLEVRGLRYPAGPLARDRWGGVEEACLISISAGGSTGHALVRCNLSASYRTVAEWVELIAPRVVLGRSLDQHPTIWADMLQWYYHQYLPIFPLSAIDVALWDLRGVIAGVPVAQLISDQARPTVRAYASIPRYRDVGAGVADGVECYEAGFSAIKIHTVRDIDVDIRLLQGLRAALPDAELMYDGTYFLSRDEALRVGRSLEALSGTWLEEPFDPFDLDSHIWLRKAQSVLVAGFETAPGAPGSACWAFDNGGFDMIEVDAVWKAGITGALQVIQHVQSRGGRIAMHHGASTTMNLANAHLVAASDGIEMIELLTPVGDYNVAGSPPRIDPATKALAIPTPGGLGQQIDWEFVEAHEVGRATVHAPASAA